jgi:hypothetical protein
MYLPILGSGTINGSFTSYRAIFFYLTKLTNRKKMAEKTLAEKIRDVYKNYAPVRPEHMVALRSTISTLYPNMNPHERAMLIAEASKKLGNYFNTVLKPGVTDVSQMIPGLQELLSEKVKSYYPADLSEILTQVRERELLDDQRQTDDSKKPVTQIEGRQKLRSRVTLPGQSDLLETPEQQVSDSVQADMWGFALTLPELGLFNKLYYNYAVWQKTVQEHANAPRTIMPDEYTMPFKRPWQFQQFTDVEMEEYLNDKFADEMSRLHALDLPKSVSLLRDTNRSTGSPFVHVAQQAPAFRPDPNLPLPAGFDNFLGFKPQTDPFRQPLLPGYQEKMWPVNPDYDMAVTDMYGYKTFMTC